MDQIQRYNLFFFFFSFLILNLKIIIIAEPVSSFSLKSFNADKNPDFDSDFTLLGNAQISNGVNFVNLTSPSSGSSSSSSSSGQIVYKKPFKFLDPQASKPISFTTDFTFTITPGVGVGGGDGIAFVIFPSDKELSKVFDQGYFGISDDVDLKFLAVEYDTRKDDNVGDLNGNHVGVDVGSFVSAEVSDVSSVGLLLNGGVPLTSWIDYEASSRRLEVRLAESGTDRPYDALISYPVDLSKMWEGKDVKVGISSSSGDSRQISSLSSWSFGIRTVPSSLHSEPLNPDVSAVQVQPVLRKKSCFLRVLGGVIFATGCGTLVAFLALFVWVMFYGRHSNVVPELSMNQVDFKYEKVNVTVDNVADDSTRSSTS